MSEVSAVAAVSQAHAPAAGVRHAEKLGYAEEQGGAQEIDVRRVAELASLELTEAEVPRMQRDLKAILGYVAQLRGLDTAGVEPMAQVGDVLGDMLGNGLGGGLAAHGETLRADQVCPSANRRAVMAEAPETDGRFFKVPKVIER